MSITKGEIRSRAYYDSVVLMQLQRSLAGQPGVIDAGVVMGTQANKHLLEQGDLLAPEVQAAGPDDMLIVVKADDEAAYCRAKVLLVLNRTFEAVESLKSSFQLDPQKRKDFEREYPGVRSIKEFKNLLRR